MNYTQHYFTKYYFTQYIKTKKLFILLKGGAEIDISSSNEYIEGYNDGLSYKSKKKFRGIDPIEYIYLYGKGYEKALEMIERKFTEINLPKFGSLHNFKRIPDYAVYNLYTNEALNECNISSATICKNILIKFQYLKIINSIDDDEFILCAGYLVEGKLSDFQVGITETLYLDEDPEQAVFRGLYEETGINVKDPNLERFDIIRNYKDHYYFYKLRLEEIDKKDIKMYYNSRTTSDKIILLAHASLDNLKKITSERNTNNLEASFYSDPDKITSDTVKNKKKRVSVLEKTNREKNNIALIAINVRFLKRIFEKLCS